MGDRDFTRAMTAYRHDNVTAAPVASRVLCDTREFSLGIRLFRISYLGSELVLEAIGVSR